MTFFIVLCFFLLLCVICQNFFVVLCCLNGLEFSKKATFLFHSWCSCESFHWLLRKRAQIRWKDKVLTTTANSFLVLYINNFIYWFFRSVFNLAIFTTHWCQKYFILCCVLFTCSMMRIFAIYCDSVFTTWRGFSGCCCWEMMIEIWGIVT